MKEKTKKFSNLKSWVLAAYAVLIVLASMYYILAAVALTRPAVNEVNKSDIAFAITHVRTDIVVANKSFTNISYNTTDGGNTGGTWTTISSTNFTISIAGYNNTNGTIYIASLPDGNYTLNITLGNKSGKKAASAIILWRIIDDTKPNVSSVTDRAGASILGRNFSIYSVGSQGGRLILNATVVDNLLNVKNVNFTLYNGTGKYETSFTTENLAGNTWVNRTGLNLSVYSDGNYTLKINVTDTANNTGVTTDINLTNLFLDKISPSVFKENITIGASTVTRGVAGKNLSYMTATSGGLLSINISVLDRSAVGQEILEDKKANVSGVGSVTFYIRNDTGINKTLAATREGSTDWWSATINATAFPDNNYTIEVRVNDTAYNANNSARTTKFIIDNTAPTISFSCGNSDYEQGSTVTCTCSASGGTAGRSSPLNTSWDSDGISYTANPSSASTGTYTIYCTAKDHAGNIGQVSTTYTVLAPQNAEPSVPTSSTPSATASSAVGTVTTTAPATVKIAEEDISTYGIESINLAVKADVADVDVNIEKYDNRPVDVTISKEGAVYKYLKIDVTNIGDSLEKAMIKIKVSKAWAGSKSLEKEDIGVFKFAGDAWRLLPTEFKSEDDTSYYYEAEATRFSYFAIGEKKGESLLEPEEEQLLAEEEEEAATNAKMWIWIGAVVIVIAIVVIAITARKKKQ